MDRRTKIERLGEINYNFYGSQMIIVQYLNKRNIVVRFDNGYQVKSNYETFKKGVIKNPYDRSVYKIGYISEGSFSVAINGKHTLYYEIWKGLLRRCYSLEFHKKQPAYKGCTVCKEWHNFQVFAKWMSENYYEIQDHEMQLDKDILVKGNKVYSPETCCFVPQNINKLFTKTDKARGEFPIGVTFKENKYISNCCNGKKKSIYLGAFSTFEEAFKAYKIGKEKVIKEIAEKYKSQIPEKLYNALMNYQVEITD